MKYNYIFFNEPDTMHYKPDEGYYGICVADLRREENVHIVYGPLENASVVLRGLWDFCNRVERHLPIPMTRMWYSRYFKNPFSDQCPLCFILFGSYCSVAYIRYLKRRYPQVRFVKIHRDLIERWRRNASQFTEDVCRELFDLRFSYDEEDAKKYNAISFREFESKIEIPIDKDCPLSDVYFAGVAKDRLPRLMEAYRIFTSAGLRCSYYLTGVPQKDRIPFPGITYADKPMAYREMLYRTVNSRCVLEINQGGAVGYTSRFLEAVMYNKKLITDNVTIRNTKFYDPRYIQCVDDVRDIRPEFVTEDAGTVDYHYDNEFSPIHLIEQIDEALIKLDAKEGRP